MQAEEADDSTLFRDVEDSLKRQIAEMRRRVEEQRERNRQEELDLRGKFDQERSKFILKALILKKGLNDVEGMRGETAKLAEIDLMKVEKVLEEETTLRTERLNRQIRQLTLLQGLFQPTPLVYRNLLQQSRYRNPPLRPLEDSPFPSPPLFPMDSSAASQSFPSLFEVRKTQILPTRLAAEGRAAGVWDLVGRYIGELKGKMGNSDDSQCRIEVEDERHSESIVGISVIEVEDERRPESVMSGKGESGQEISEILPNPDQSSGNSNITPEFDPTNYHFSPQISILELTFQEGNTEEENRVAILNSSLVHSHPELAMNQGDMSNADLSLASLSSDQLIQSEEVQKQPVQREEIRVRRGVWRCWRCCFGRH